MKFWLWLFDKQCSQYVAWKYYEMGFSGNDTTALDKKPDFPKPKLLWFIKNALDEAGEEMAKYRRECWRNTMINCLGEDPDDSIYPR